MSSATVRLRNDLVISARMNGGTIFVIKDPVTERYFRFKETEHFMRNNSTAQLRLKLRGNV